MFELKRPITRNSKTDLEDTARVKLALTSLGHYDDTETGLSPYADNQFFHSVKAFQKENNLKVDGIINPEGETHTKIKEKLATDEKSGNAFGDFWKNYMDMREADTIDADKYFHCKANYEASERGFDGEQAAEKLSDQRAWYKKNMRNNSNLDIFRDQGSNIYGREAAKAKKFNSAREACEIFRPKGLNEKY